MAYQQTVKHKHGVVVYSIYELEKWLHETRRLEEDEMRYQRGEVTAGQGMVLGVGDCPSCGWPAGTKGFVRAPALPHEWAYGKLFACPTCWPYPLGKAGDVATTSEQDQQLEAAKPRVFAVRGKA